MEKTLSNDQRKILDRLYMEEFDRIDCKRRDQRQEERRALIESLNADVKDVDISAARLLHAQLRDLLERLRKRYGEDSAIGLSAPGYLEENTPRLFYRDNGRYGSNRGLMDKRIIDFDAATDALMERIQDARRDAQCKIYGLNTTFNAIRKEIDKLVASL